MRQWIAVLAAVALLISSNVRAADTVPGTVIMVETRGVVVPIHASWRDDAVATVVLYSGGGGGYGAIGTDGWPASMNFLIRSARLFAAHPFNIVMVGRPRDGLSLNGTNRIGDAHDQDNQAIFKAVKARSGVPLWLVGTSMGTISAAAAAIRDGGRQVAGVVLTSSVTTPRIRGAVPTQELERITVPVLVVHHARDACGACTPDEARTIENRLKSAPVVRTMMLDGGENPTGDPCEPMHYHGFIGMEKKTVDLIADWIRRPVR